ncbi:putative lactate oxidase [Pseudomonas cichorii]|uniref:Alpha-hydroxy-acid oxidizing protein n=1 Tax=Pseudomonas serbiensis TaxID=3064350 RepID=A0ABT9CUY1_9PSED|nr:MULTISPECIES: alpha-hydroxy-acid oxidizing protein [Pseudomonas]MDO7929296.1 alpha-hydroxy-acid oxidizing protein [Pseudomonas sp. KFB-138]GFM89428.1 putative lactate oxidase [Pseudomonas cichorii]
MTTNDACVPDVPDAPVTFSNLIELESRAAKVIPTAGFEYIARGAGDEQTLRENREAFSRAFIDQRILTGKVVETLETSILGVSLRSPITIAAMASQGIAHPSAESGTAIAADHVGTLLCVSTVSTQSLETIAAASAGPKWFQLYLTRDDGFNRELLNRARAAGYTAVVLTADVTVGGIREHNRRNGFDAGHLRGNFIDAAGNPRCTDRSFQPALSLDAISYAHEHSGLPVVVKGVTTSQDALRVIEHGAAAIQVSNHGGRQLDGSPAAFTSLLHVAESVEERVPIIFDSGIRRGTDVFKAIAAGADVVALGRPVLYGLALGGWRGVVSVLEHLDNELRTVMQLAGAATVADIRSTRLTFGLTDRQIPGYA